MIKLCKHCYSEFEARRKNHVYCCSSCKTLASYKRNEYKYVSGRYLKEDNKNELALNTTIVKENQLTETKQKMKVDKVSQAGVANAGLGALAADTLSYGVKKLFAPDTLPATKGDVELLRQELLRLHFLLAEK